MRFGDNWVYVFVLKFREDFFKHALAFPLFLGVGRNARGRIFLLNNVDMFRYTLTYTFCSFFVALLAEMIRTSGSDFRKL
jgi:hypothetical protein